MRKALLTGLSMALLATPAFAAGHGNGGSNNGGNQTPQDPYHYDSYANNPGISNVTTSTQTTNAIGQPLSSSTTTYDQGHFGYDVQNTTRNTNGTTTTYDQSVDYARPTTQPPLSGTTTKQLTVNPNTNEGGYAPNPVYAPGTTTSTSGTTTTTGTNPYYNSSNGQISIDNSSINMQSGVQPGPPAHQGGNGPQPAADPANSANVTPGFSSHASYNGD